MVYHSTYKKCNIYKIPRNSYGMVWESYAGFTFVQADTLAGIKKMITLKLQGGAK